LLDRTHAFVDSHLSRNYVVASRALQKHSGNLSNSPSFFLRTFRLALFTTFVTAYVLTYGDKRQSKGRVAGVEEIIFSFSGLRSGVNCNRAGGVLRQRIPEPRTR
jgi:hypothetical protein